MKPIPVHRGKSVLASCPLPWGGPPTCQQRGAAPLYRAILSPRVRGRLITSLVDKWHVNCLSGLIWIKEEDGLTEKHSICSAGSVPGQEAARLGRVLMQEGKAPLDRSHSR